MGESGGISASATATPNSPAVTSSAVKVAKSPAEKKTWAKSNFTLPPGWTRKQHKTDKSSWTTYISPEGKSYRNMKAVENFVLAQNIINTTKNDNNNPTEEEMIDNVIDTVISYAGKMQNGDVSVNDSTMDD